jgi:lipopolysaccharide biosynthesis glycosyltransferase
MRKQATIYVGFDPREAAAFAVARESIRRRLTAPIQIKGLVLDSLKNLGLYWRPTEKRLGKLWDVISGAPMSTEFAISRFLVPHLHTQGGWALFMDCDMLAKGNLVRIFDELEQSNDAHKAVYVVKHVHEPTNTTKMDDCVQTSYARKNWSSFMVFNCDHPANKRLTLELINSARGLDLHQFCWLQDDEIGELDPKWNYLVGHTVLPEGVDPKVVHYTDGGPWFTGLETVAYADDWRAELNRWAAWA